MFMTFCTVVLKAEVSCSVFILFHFYFKLFLKHSFSFRMWGISVYFFHFH